jgi:hypothetical protein
MSYNSMKTELFPPDTVQLRNKLTPFEPKVELAATEPKVGAEKRSDQTSASSAPLRENFLENMY